MTSFALRTLSAALFLALPLACANEVSDGPAPDDSDSPTLLDPIDEAPAVEDPPAEDPPAEDPPAEDPPAEDPPAEDPPAEDPPAEDPPVVAPGGETPIVCPTGAGDGRRAVLIIERGLGGQVRLFQLDDKGVLTDTGDAIALDLPHAVTFRPDGLEALVAFGTSSSGTTGVLVLDIAADGSSMSAKGVTDLGDVATPRHVTYSGTDSAIVTRIGPGHDDIVPLTRDMTGAFTAGTQWEVPGEWPQQAVGIPGQDHSALLLRTNLLGPDYLSEVIPLNDAGGVIDATGPALVFDNRQYYLYPHPSGDRVYLHTGHPDAADNDLDPAGQLHVLTRTTSGWQTESAPFTLPDRASMATVSPAGDRLVVADPKTEMLTGPTGNMYIGTERYELYAVTLDDDGLPVSASAARATFHGTLIYGLSAAPTGHVVVAWDAGTQIPGVDDAVAVFHETATGWVQVCDLVDIDGSALVAVSPAP